MSKKGMKKHREERGMRVDKNRENSGKKRRKIFFDRNWNGNAGNVDCPGKK